MFDRKTSSFQTTSVGVVSVVDLRGKRLTTVYLDQVAEPNPETAKAYLASPLLAGILVSLPASSTRGIRLPTGAGLWGVAESG